MLILSHKLSRNTLYGCIAVCWIVPGIFTAIGPAAVATAGHPFVRPPLNPRKVNPYSLMLDLFTVRMGWRMVLDRVVPPLSALQTLVPCISHLQSAQEEI